MIGLGTSVNTIAIIAGGIVGSIIEKFLNEKRQDSIMKACGVSVMMLGIAGSMEGMLTIQENAICSGKSMLVVLCIALGTIMGELLDIEKIFDCFGRWLKVKTGNGKDDRFVNAFVTTSLTVCIGAMAIVGAIQDGILKDSTTLIVKAILDFLIVAIMSSSLGKGALFSFVPVFLFEGSITLLASFLAPIMNELAISYLSLIGSLLIFCVGVNLVWGKMYKVANMLPALLLAILCAYLPIGF